jgi:hypothetical protein
MTPRHLVAFLGILVIAALVSYTVGSATQDAVTAARPLMGASASRLTTFSVLLLLTGAIPYFPTGVRALWDRELPPSISILTSAWTLACGLIVFAGMVALESSTMILMAPGNADTVSLAIALAGASFMGAGLRGMVLNVRASRRAHRASQ